jgi:hypothetical protein
MHDILGLLSTSAGVGVLFASFNRVGAFFEREADNQWRSNLTAYLRNAGWVSGTVKSLRGLGNLFNNIYGDAIFSKKFLFQSFKITTFSLIVISLYYILARGFHGFVLDQSNVSVGYFYISKILGAAAFDLLSAIRVRYIIRRLALSVHIFRDSMVYIAIDAFFIVVAMTIVNFLAMTLSVFFERPGADIRALPQFTYLFFKFVVGKHDMLLDVFSLQTAYELLLFKDVFGIFVYAALVPSIILYTFIFSIVFCRALGMLDRKISEVSRRLKFKKPFLFVFNIAGGIISVLLSIMIWFAH